MLRYDAFPDRARSILARTACARKQLDTFIAQRQNIRPVLRFARTDETHFTSLAPGGLEAGLRFRGDDKPSGSQGNLILRGGK